MTVLLVAIVLKGWQPCPAIDPLDHTVLLPNPSDCSSFFVCSNGVPILQRCPGELHFNAYLNTCDWPQHARCSDGGVFFGDDRYYEHLYTNLGGGGGIPVIGGDTIVSGPATIIEVRHYEVPMWCDSKSVTEDPNMFAGKWYSQPQPCRFEKKKPTRLNETTECTTKF